MAGQEKEAHQMVVRLTMHVSFTLLASSTPCQQMCLWGFVQYLLRKTESAGWDRDSAERDWSTHVWMEVCGMDSMS